VNGKVSIEKKISFATVVSTVLATMITAGLWKKKMRTVCVASENFEGQTPATTDSTRRTVMETNTLRESPTDEISATAKRMIEILDSRRMSVVQIILTLATVNVMILDRHMEGASRAGGLDMIRIIRKALHTLPNALTQFLNAWQPGRSKEALSTVSNVIADKINEAEREAADADQARMALYRRQRSDRVILDSGIPTLNTGKKLG
jgi:hypothetical protein